MEKRHVCLLVPLLIVSCTARSEGPPKRACFDMAPQHDQNMAQTTTSPVTFAWADDNITANAIIQPGQYIRVTLEYEAGSVFKGFMIQARGGGPPGEGSNSSDAEQQIVGTFLQHSSYNTLHCSRADDTATHMDSGDKHFVTVTWIAPDDVPDEISFFYTIVENFETFWVMQESPDKLLGRPEPLSGNELYIKIHGSLMAIAWGFLVPVAMIIALFYKLVFTNGLWFYIHILVMVVAVLTVIGGVVVILLYTEWTWLDTNNLYVSYEVLGIISLAAVVVNPLLALFLIFECCNLGRPWRKVYDFCHVTTGLFALGVALCAMLVGVHILRDHPRNFDVETVHSAIYSVSAIAATVTLTMALYNGYHIRYHKDHPKPGIHEEDPLRLISQDWWLRLAAGGVAILLLLAPVATTIYFLSKI